METENKVWVITGEDWNDERGDRVVIGVCPTKEDAVNVKLRFLYTYSEIWIQEFSLRTYDKPFVAYKGRFRAELHFIGEKHYVLGKIDYVKQEGEPLSVDCNVKEKFEFSVGHIIKTDGPEVYIISGEFTSAEEAPTEGEAAKGWIIQKANEKGLITLESSGF